MGSLFLLERNSLKLVPAKAERIDMPSRRIRCSVCGLLHDAENIRRTNEGKYICTSCIENSNGEYVECTECHRVEHARRVEDTDIFVSNMTDIDDKTLCDECRDYLYYQCQDCGSFTLKEELILIDNKLVCRNCQSNFVECPICHRTVHHANLVTVHTGEGEETHICSQCAQVNYTRCIECGEYFTRGALSRVYPTGWICNECAQREDYEVCGDCGAIVRNYNMVYDDEEEGELDTPLCRGCYNSRFANVIHNYHCDENFTKRSTEEDNPNEQLYLGLEIEVGGNRDYARGFLKYFRPENDVMLMNDASVSGFEIVTNPMTYKYIQKTFYPRLEKGMEYLVNNDFKGHNAGGIHIHISEEAVTKYQVAQLAEILYGNKNDYETWLILTQRKRENTTWCRFNGNRKFYDITDATEDKPYVDSARHTALNHDTRTRTYEFRIFNSSLRMDRIKKNVQCVIALLDYTSDHRFDERPVCNLTAFLEYVMGRKIFYPELASFIEEKNLLEAHKNKDYSTCNMSEQERNRICA